MYVTRRPSQLRRIFILLLNYWSDCVTLCVSYVVMMTQPVYNHWAARLNIQMGSTVQQCHIAHKNQWGVTMWHQSLKVQAVNYFLTWVQGLCTMWLISLSSRGANMKIGPRANDVFPNITYVNKLLQNMDRVYRVNLVVLDFGGDSLVYIWIMDLWQNQCEHFGPVWSMFRGSFTGQDLWSILCTTGILHSLHPVTSVYSRALTTAVNWILRCRADVWRKTLNLWKYRPVLSRRKSWGVVFVTAVWSLPF